MVQWSDNNLDFIDKGMNIVISLCDDLDQKDFDQFRTLVKVPRDSANDSAIACMTLELIRKAL